jgi:CheY-like chemotaxis protein
MMTDYLIVDSNLTFARELYRALAKVVPNRPGDKLVDPSAQREMTVREVAEVVQERVDKQTIILISAEAVVGSSYRQAQEAIELAFWLRCKHNLTNAIVFYSVQSASQLLRARPDHFILLSPGCYHFRLPLTREQLDKICQLKSLQDLSVIKLHLKNRIDLTQTRHQFANYAGMDLMMLVAKTVWGSGKEAIDEKNALFSKLSEFRESLDYFLLRTYFDLATLELSNKIPTSLKVRLAKRRILLIDDLAEAWQPIIGQMLYGKDEKVIAESIEHLKIVTERGGKTLDLKNTKVALKKHIEAQKPHLILLDLRLSGEEGKRKVEELGGYQLLKFLKKDPLLRGLPVIAFTASGNAETTKALIEQGAEAVWTKPGLDESLSTETVVERYEALIGHVRGVINRFDEDVAVASSQDIEQSRLRILRRIEYLRYRAKLSNLRGTPHFFNHFTDIFVDTSAVIDSAEAICSLYKLAHICGETNHVICVNGTDFSISVPKVIFINFVIDEIIHWSKKVDEDKPYFWKLALLAYDVVRGLFQDNLVRTEFTLEENSHRPFPRFTRTSHRSYADDPLVYEATAIVPGGPFELWREFLDPQTLKRTTGKDNARYKTHNRRVLVITKESRKTLNGIPARIEDAVSNNRPGEAVIFSLDDLVYRLKEIPM